jgi:MFS family permease
VIRERLREIGGGLPRPFWVLFVGMFVNRVGTLAVPFLAVYLTQARHFSIATAGVVLSLYGAGAMIASPVGGYLADHAGRRRTMVGALALGGCGMVALGFARDLAQIAPAVFVVALVGESYRPAMQAAVADIVPAQDRIRAYGLVYWVINLGVSIGLTLGGVLAAHSFLLLFAGDGLTSIAFAFIVWRALPETRPAPGTHGSALRPHGLVRGFLAPYRDRAFLAFIALSALVLLVFMQHATALPLDMVAHGVARSSLGLVMAVNGILIVFVQPFLAPRLAVRNRSRVLASGCTLVGVGFGLNVLAHGAPAFALNTALWTLGEICVLPIANAVVADIALPELRGRYQGAYGLCFGLAAFLAPLAGTATMQHAGARTLWLGCLGVALAVAAGHLVLEPRLTRLRMARLESRR